MAKRVDLYGKHVHKNDEPKGDKKNPVLVLGIILALIALVLGGLFVANMIIANSSDGTGASRENIIKLAERYRDRGEYSRALDLLDQLLLKNPDDEEAKRLQDAILEEKQQKEAAVNIQSDKNREADAARERETLDKLIDSSRTKT